MTRLALMLSSVVIFVLSSSGVAPGVLGETNSTSFEAVGVFGKATFTTTNITYGVKGESNSTRGRGVQGLATATSGSTFGVRGISSSTSGHGAQGRASATSGVNYGVQGSSSSTSGFDFFASGAGTNYGSSSSRRWKSNIEPIGDPLGKLAQLRGVYYDWDEEHGGHHDLGMIADEVGGVLPEIVQYEENGVDAIGMDYSKMTPLLVEAVNALRAEQDAAITALSANDDALRAENASLRARLESLESFVERLASAQQKEDSQ